MILSHIFPQLRQSFCTSRALGERAHGQDNDSLELCPLKSWAAPKTVYLDLDLMTFLTLFHLSILDAQFRFLVLKLLLGNLPERAYLVLQGTNATPVDDAKELTIRVIAC